MPVGPQHGGAPARPLADHGSGGTGGHLHSGKSPEQTGRSGQGRPWSQHRPGPGRCPPPWAWEGPVGWALTPPLRGGGGGRSRLIRQALPHPQATCHPPFPPAGRVHPDRGPSWWWAGCIWTARARDASGASSISWAPRTARPTPSRPPACWKWWTWVLITTASCPASSGAG